MESISYLFMGSFIYLSLCYHTVTGDFSNSNILELY